MAQQDNKPRGEVAVAVREPDPLAEAAGQPEVLKIAVQDYNEQETGEDPLISMLPRRLGEVEVCYFFWDPENARLTEPLYRYAHPVTREARDGLPGFASFLPDSVFSGAGGRGQIESNRRAGHLYAGNLMCFWVPRKTVDQQRAAAMKIEDAKLAGIARGKVNNLDPGTGTAGGSSVQIGRARVGTHQVTIDD